ncbi:tetraacyldisaccharide 4'-kinase [Flavobacteriaceae bacterium LMO-SS05]
MKILRYILFPVVPFYYLVTWLRNKLYDLGLKSSTHFDLPVICVGNLSVGGTGKTPMIEYLIRLLKDNYKIATLSRGYKRKTDGFVLADNTKTALDMGDEPFQFYKKFNDIMVSVDADRRNGIRQLLALEDKPDLILLDDAFQHRKVKAGFNILLMPYDAVFSNHLVLPTGNLREPKSGVKRADVIVVTKCPTLINETEKQQIIQHLKPLDHQFVFFSAITYSETIKNSSAEKKLQDLKGKSFTLVTGIANANPLVDYLHSEGLNFEHLNFRDHHEFSKKEIEYLKSKEWIVTTEKDFMRLEQDFKNSITLYYLPIEITLSDAKIFDALIEEFISSF